VSEGAQKLVYSVVAIRARSCCFERGIVRFEVSIESLDGQNTPYTLSKRPANTSVGFAKLAATRSYKSLIVKLF
jgi:hypothetical protein